MSHGSKRKVSSSFEILPYKQKWHHNVEAKFEKLREHAHKSLVDQMLSRKRQATLVESQSSEHADDLTLVCEYD